MFSRFGWTPFVHTVQGLLENLANYTGRRQTYAIDFCSNLLHVHGVRR